MSRLCGSRGIRIQISICIVSSRAMSFRDPWVAKVWPYQDLDIRKLWTWAAKVGKNTREIMSWLSRLKLSAWLCNQGLNTAAARLLRPSARIDVQTFQIKILGATKQLWSESGPNLKTKNKDCTESPRFYKYLKKKFRERVKAVQFIPLFWVAPSPSRSGKSRRLHIDREKFDRFFLGRAFSASVWKFVCAVSTLFMKIELSPPWSRIWRRFYIGREGRVSLSCCLCLALEFSVVYALVWKVRIFWSRMSVNGKVWSRTSGKTKYGTRYFARAISVSVATVVANKLKWRK